MGDKYTVTVERDAEECMDIRNASAYTGIASMQLRQYAHKGALSSIKRAPLDDPAGRIKIWLHVTDLDMLVQRRAARLRDKSISVRVGGKVCYRAQKIKSVRAMVQSFECDSGRCDVAVTVLSKMLTEALDACRAKQNE